MNKLALLAALAQILMLPACQTVTKPARQGFVDRLESAASPDSESALEAAERDLESGKWKVALGRLESLCTENPSCARISILARRAVSLAPESERPGLVSKIREKIRRESDVQTDPLAIASLAFAEALFAADERDEERALRKALAAEPDHYYALCKLGEKQWRRGELEAARSSLEKVVSLRQDLAEGWLLLAQVAEDRALHKLAAKHYESYLGLRPLDRRVQKEYARLLVHSVRDGVRAEEILAPIRRDDPGDLDVGLDLGRAFFLQGRHRDAERLYLGLLERWPREPRLLYSLGNLYYGALDAPAQALQAYRWMMQQRGDGELMSSIVQAFFVPARVRQIEATLQKSGQGVPPPPTSVQDLFDLASRNAKRSAP